MYTNESTILMCADIYDKLHHIVSYTWLIIVMVSYAVSLPALMATFVIHLCYRELRILPVLMLMNLTAALFVTQLLFLLSTWDLFETDPVLCQIMASTQHYFWLASFA